MQPHPVRDTDAHTEAEATVGDRPMDGYLEMCVRDVCSVGICKRIVLWLEADLAHRILTSPVLAMFNQCQGMGGLKRSLTSPLEDARYARC